jgi:hypothetical protein
LIKLSLEELKRGYQVDVANIVSGLMSPMGDANDVIRFREALHLITHLLVEAMLPNSGDECGIGEPSLAYQKRLDELDAERAFLALLKRLFIVSLLGRSGRPAFRPLEVMVENGLPNGLIAQPAKISQGVAHDVRARVVEFPESGFSQKGALNELGYLG